MKSFRFNPLIQPSGKAVFACACLAALLMYGIYFIDIPSRTYTAGATLKYFYDDGINIPAADIRPAGSAHILPDYFLSKPSFYKKVGSLVMEKTGIAVSVKDMPHMLQVSKSEKDSSFHVRSFHRSRLAALTLVQSFVSELLSEVESAEVGHLKKVRKKMENELEKVQNKLAKVKALIHKSQADAGQTIQEKIKLIEDTKQQTVLRKSEAEGVLSRLLARLRNEPARTVSGTTVNVNPEHKEARFKLLDLQEALRRKKEDGQGTQEEIRLLESKINALNKRINTKIPKYVEVPTVNSNPVYEFLSQKIVQQRILVSSLGAQILTEDKKVKELRKKAMLESSQSADVQKLLGESESLENQVYLIQGILVDLKLDEFRSSGSLMLMSQSRSAQVVKPRNIYEVAAWLSVLLLTFLYALRVLRALRKGVIDFRGVLESFHVPVLVSHAGQEKNNIYVARTITYICHEMPLRTILFLSCSPQVSSSAIGDISVHLSQKAGKVLLVDADIRHPSLHGFFESRQSPGFLQLLTDDAPEFSYADAGEFFVREIEKRIIPITSECGFMGAGSSSAGGENASLKKIKKERLEKLFNTLKAYDVLVAFYSSYDGNEQLLAEILPVIEGVVLCCPAASEICSYHRSLLSFLEKYQHKIIGSIIFERNRQELSGLPAMYRAET